LGEGNDEVGEGRNGKGGELREEWEWGDVVWSGLPYVN